jgi:hypothetical protein
MPLVGHELSALCISSVGISFILFSNVKRRLKELRSEWNWPVLNKGSLGRSDIFSRRTVFRGLLLLFTELGVVLVWIKVAADQRLIDALLVAGLVGLLSLLVSEFSIWLVGLQIHLAIIYPAFLWLQLLALNLFLKVLHLILVLDYFYVSKLVTQLEIEDNKVVVLFCLVLN